MENKIVRWEQLLPKEFIRLQTEKSLVFLPLGICEPHGHISPFGLDTLKAEYLCEEAARRFGGIVAPTLGYQIHESGYHAPWLEEAVGEENPHMNAMPPDVMLRFFLYQLRSFVNAGFKNIFVLTGHSGGNQEDYRLVAECFMRSVPVDIVVKSDPELVTGIYEGDHAGKYEISQLLYIHPELMAMDRLQDPKTDALGRFAQGEDASEATEEFGKRVIEASIASMGNTIEGMQQHKSAGHKIDYMETELIWKEILGRMSEWVTLKPRQGQVKVSKHSQWLPYEDCYVQTELRWKH